MDVEAGADSTGVTLLSRRTTYCDLKMSIGLLASGALFCRVRKGLEAGD